MRVRVRVRVRMRVRVRVRVRVTADHQDPLKQGSHSSLALRPTSAPTVPEGHGVGAELPSAHLVRVGLGLGLG